MPIGTSDGQHFEDEFHQAVVQQQQKSNTPLPRPRPTPDQSTTPSQASPEPMYERNGVFELFKNTGIEPTDFVEDRRTNPLAEDFAKKQGQDARAKESGYSSQEARKANQYLYQDLSKYEKDPLSIQAGIKNIPHTRESDAIVAHNRRVVLVREIANDPSILKAISNPQIDREHEVPYIAGASKDLNDFTTHVDKSLPKTVTISGKTFDPAIPLNIHEQIERSVMEKLIKGGMKEDQAYQIAHHEYAQVAEDNWYRQNGIDVKEVDKFWKKVNYKTEKDKGDFPPDLYTKPYPHDQVKGEKHTPSNVFQEWRQPAAEERSDRSPTQK